MYIPHFARRHTHTTYLRLASRPEVMVILRSTTQICHTTHSTHVAHAAHVAHAHAPCSGTEACHASSIHTHAAGWHAAHAHHAAWIDVQQSV